MGQDCQKSVHIVKSCLPEQILQILESIVPVQAQQTRKETGGVLRTALYPGSKIFRSPIVIYSSLARPSP